MKENPLFVLKEFESMSPKQRKINVGKPYSGQPCQQQQRQASSGAPDDLSWKVPTLLK